MIRREIKSFCLLVDWRKAIFSAPIAGDFRNVRIGRIPVTHVNFKARLIENAVLLALQPIIPPARGFYTPFNRPAGLSVVRKSVIPRAEQRFYRRMRSLQEAANAVTISIEKTTDHESGNFVFSIPIAGDRGTLPKRPVALLMKIEKKPGSGIETSCQRFF